MMSFVIRRSACVVTVLYIVGTSSGITGAASLTQPPLQAGNGSRSRHAMVST